MDIRKVKKLIELLEESNIAEIEIHEGEESVRISRKTEAMLSPQYHAGLWAGDVRAHAVRGINSRYRSGFR